MSTVEQVADQARHLPPLDKLDLLERILRQLDIHQPGIAELYEKIADIEAVELSNAVTEGRESVRPLADVISDARRRLNGD
jgi:hypothetical protein